MKARDAIRLSTVRMMKAAIQNREVDLRAELDDAQVFDVLKTLIKQRREAIEQFRRGGRQDLVDKESAEIKVIEEYLPAPVSDEEIEKVVAEVIAATGASPAKGIGPVMKQCMVRFAGRIVDGGA
jgi:uncharacterized protein YqeY